MASESRRSRAGPRRTGHEPDQAARPLEPVEQARGSPVLPPLRPPDRRCPRRHRAHQPRAARSSGPNMRPAATRPRAGTGWHRGGCRDAAPDRDVSPRAGAVPRPRRHPNGAKAIGCPWPVVLCGRLCWRAPNCSGSSMRCCRSRRPISTVGSPTRCRLPGANAAREAEREAERRRLREAHRVRLAAAKREYEAGERRQAEFLESLGFTRGPDGLYVPPSSVPR